MLKITNWFEGEALVEGEREVISSYERLIEQFGERHQYRINGDPYGVVGARHEWHSEWITQGGAEQVECILFLPVGTEDVGYPYDNDAHYSLFWHPELKRWCEEYRIGWGREDSTETMRFVHERDAVTLA